MTKSFLNGTSVSLSEIANVDLATFEAELKRGRILALWSLPDTRVTAVIGNAETHRLEVVATAQATYERLKNRVPAVHRFEAEMLGASEDDEEVTPLKGEAAHEVAVGPVHAGVIEPGHFRFQCMGEDVHSLEIRLGYQHRGAEKLITEAKSDARRIALAETVAGDSSIAASRACELALGLKSSLTPKFFTLLLELERIANHVGDLGALSGDVAYLPTASFCGRIRGEYLNMTAEFVGNRFGRNSALALFPSKETIEKVREWFIRTEHELFHALDLLFKETGAVERFEGTGRVPAALAKEIGLVGMAGRASGLKTDSRVDFPFSEETVKTSLVASEVELTGDVLSRARQRYEELKVSHELVRHLLAEGDLASTPTPSPTPTPTPTPSSLTVAVVEAWRGELVHLAVRDEKGELVQYKIFDPSHHNWFGLAQALKGEQISNFPICNKSFNLSYCGVDR